MQGWVIVGPCSGDLCGNNMLGSHGLEAGCKEPGGKDFLEFSDCPS